MIEFQSFLVDGAREGGLVLVLQNVDRLLRQTLGPKVKTENKLDRLFLINFPFTI